MMQLALKNISLNYGNAKLFSDLNFCLSPGETVCIQTGVLDGGTSLLKIMAGLMSPTSGQVLLDGRPMAEYTDTELFKAVTMCFETGGVLDIFSNYNNIVLPILYHLNMSGEAIHRRIERVAAPLNLIEVMDDEPFQLNDVQKRLLNLCKALVIEPEIIIIDELQAGMSPAMRDDVIALLQREQQRRPFSIVMSTTAGDRTDFADRTFTIKEQTILQEAV